MKSSIARYLPINRVVILLTPVFTTAAAVGTAWVGKHFPGIPVPSKAQLVVYEASGATAALTMAAGWLRGHHTLEADLRAAERIALGLAASVTDAAELKSPPPALNATPVSQEVGIGIPTHIQPSTAS